MNKSEIREQILKIAEKYASDKTASDFNNNELKSYHLVSANLLKYMPDINPENHREIYQNLLKLKILENIPQFFKTFNLDNFFINLPEKKFSKNTPAIYASFHTGAYRTALLPLVKNNINLVIIIDTTIYRLEELEKVLLSHFDLAKEIFPDSTTHMKILSASDKNTIIELMEKIGKGYSVLTYIDWNSGFNNTNNNIIVDFFHEKISVRQSIAFLSFYFKCPIIPLISYYDKDYEPHWIMFKSILPNNFTDVRDYAHYAMQNLYTYLQETVLNHYNEWQGWFHIHKSNIFKSNNNVSKNNFEPELSYKITGYAGLFTISNSYFVINKLTYKIVKLTKELYNQLLCNNLEKNMGLNILKQLYNNGIIKRC